MPLNRRQVLIGLGGLTIGGGALIGTGAFTTVEAQRTVTLETASDAEAFLGMQIRDDLAADQDTIGLDFGDTGLNINARTVFEQVLLVQNNGTQEGVSIEFDAEINGNDADDVFSFEENNDGEFDDGGDGISPDGTPLDPGQSAAFDLEIDLREDEVDLDAVGLGDLGPDDEFDVTVTITAEAAE